MSQLAALLRREPWLRWVLGAVIAGIAFGLLTTGIAALLPGPSGPSGSVYATSAGGVAAYGQLLSEAGHRVVTLRHAPSSQTIPRDVTLFVLDPPYLAAPDVRAIERFVRSGGHLVAGGANPQPWVNQLLARPPVWHSGGGAEAHVVVAAPEDAGVSRITEAGNGAWITLGQTRELIAANPGAELVTARVGRGRIDLLADVAPLENHYLAIEDDAQLALDLAGPRGRPDWFVETVHGYGAAAGLAALPERWRIALIGALVTGLMFVLANARRLGPPDRRSPAQPPERFLYVRSLAASMARARHPYAAAEPVRLAALALAKRLGAQADPASLETLGTRVGAPPGELERLLETPDDAGGVMAVGRALRNLRRLRR